MRILLTGGGGFVGGYVLRSLLSDAATEVVVFDQNIAAAQKREPVPAHCQGRLFWEKGDVTSRESLDRVLREYEIDKVVHLAYVLMQAAEDNPPKAIRVNCEGTNNIFAACLAAKVKKTVWASSIAVFGSPGEYDDEILTNGAKLKPHTIYGACKAFDEYISEYYQRAGLDLVGLRFSLVYGHGRAQVTGSGADFVTDLIEKAVASSNWVSVPYGEEHFDFLYVEDAARAVILALDQNSRAGTYTICGDYRPLREMAAYVKRLAPEANIRLQPGTYGLYWRHDMKPALEGISYFPEYTMEMGVKKYIDQLKEKAEKAP